MRALASVVVALGMGALPALLPAHAGAALRCHIEQGYKTMVLEFYPSDNPYTFEPVEVRGRFRFKAVVIGDAQRVDYVKLYAYYYLHGQPVLAHMTHYPTPVAQADPADAALTGLQRVYSPRLGFEMQYHCALHAIRP